MVDQKEASMSQLAVRLYWHAIRSFSHVSCPYEKHKLRCFYQK